MKERKSLYLHMSEVKTMSLIIVKAQLHALVKEESTKQQADVDNITADVAERLDKKVKQIVANAVARAKENNRKTLMGRDI